MSTIIPIIIFLLILSLVIFIHELGHYIAARKAGIFVEEFALGMGPKLITFRGKKPSLRPTPEGEEPEVTLYTLRILPIGGFCRMRGQDEEAPDDPEALNNKSIKARFFVMAGGSIMNFLLAFVLFFALVLLRGYPFAEVRSVVDGMPAAQAGLEPGDRITHMNGSRVTLYENFLFMIDTLDENPVGISVDRSGQRHDLVVSPVQGPEGYRIGITFGPGLRPGLLHQQPESPVVPFQRVNAVESVVTAGEMIAFHIRAPFRLLARFVTRQPMPEGGGLMGPIGIGAAITEIYQESIQFGVLDTLLTMLFFAALLNAALGIMNLLPIPALDGARLIFLLIEGVRRKPVPPEREAMVHLVGIVALLLLAVFIAYRDIVRLL